MDIKQYKKDLENNVTESIKKLVSEGVEVGTSYDIEKDTISVFLMEENKKEDLRDSLVVYNCIYNNENSLTTVVGFVRRYAYDNFGVAAVVNEPVAVDENFINGMKAAIFSALRPEIEDKDASDIAE